MAIPKTTPSQPPKPKAKTSRPIKLSLSTELVGDSDDSDVQQSSQPKKAKIQDGKFRSASIKPKQAKSSTTSAVQSKTSSGTLLKPSKTIQKSNEVAKDNQDVTNTDENTTLSVKKSEKPRVTKPATSKTTSNSNGAATKDSQDVATTDDEIETRTKQSRKPRVTTPNIMKTTSKSNGGMKDSQDKSTTDDDVDDDDDNDDGDDDHSDASSMSRDSTPTPTKDVPASTQPGQKKPTTKPLTNGKRPKDSTPPDSNAGDMEESEQHESEGSQSSGSASDSSSSHRELSPTPAKNVSALSHFEHSKTITKSLTNGKHLKGSTPPKTKSGREDESEESGGEENQSNESASSDSGREGEPGSSAATSSPSPRKKIPAQQVVSNPNVPPYEPPAGFVAASISVQPSSKISEIFAPSNLAGKQIWHITTPASVPITSIKEIPSDSVQNGATVLSHKGADYGLVTETEAEMANNHSLLLPSMQSNGYRPCKTSVFNTLHLQQQLNLPTRAQLSARTHAKAPHQQPQGLKMRYQPFGASSDSDSDMADVHASKAPQFHAPETMQPKMHAKKRKHSDVEADEQTDSASPVNAKKPKSRHEAPVEVEVSAIGNGNQEKGRSKFDSVTETPQKTSSTAVNGVESQGRKKKRRQDGEADQGNGTPAASQSILPADVSKGAEIIMADEVVNLDEGIQTNPTKQDAKEKVVRKKERRKRKSTETGEAANSTPQHVDPK